MSASPPTPSLSHLDAEGRARMVDVSAKASTRREASASGEVRMSPATRALALAGQGRKGDVFAAAEIAGVMAAKRTAELIPLCHPLALTAITVEVRPVAEGLGVEARVKTEGPTGVEMEALTAASVALLTLYDMLKAAEKTMVITDLKVIAKTGGRSDESQSGESQSGESPSVAGFSRERASGEGHAEDGTSHA